MPTNDRLIRRGDSALLKVLIAERDRLYEARFKAAETAVAAALAAQEKAIGAALAAQEKQTASSFQASEKAIVKAEDAQREYNIRSNEFRGQLDDQAKTLMARLEAMGMFKGVEDRIGLTRTDLESRIHLLSTSTEKSHDAMMAEVIALRETVITIRSERDGRSSGGTAMSGYVVGVVGFVLSLLALWSFFKGH